MDYLATFKDTISVLQAEQILIRRGIPFETVPYSRFRRSGCGLAIQFSGDYLAALLQALDEVHLESHVMQLESEIPL